MAFVVMDTFLRVNDWEITAEHRAIYAMMLDLANGEIEKCQLAQWLRENCQ